MRHRLRQTRHKGKPAARLISNAPRVCRLGTGRIGAILRRKERRLHTLPIPRPSSAKEPEGAVQIKTLSAMHCPGKTEKHLTTIDHLSRRRVAMAASNATPASAARFLDKLEPAAPCPNRAIQVDGGSEFVAVFERPATGRASPLSVCRRNLCGRTGGSKGCRPHGTANHKAFRMHRHESPN